MEIFIIYLFIASELYYDEFTQLGLLVVLFSLELVEMITLFTVFFFLGT